MKLRKSKKLLILISIPKKIKNLKAYSKTNQKKKSLNNWNKFLSN